MKLLGRKPLLSAEDAKRIQQLLVNGRLPRGVRKALAAALHVHPRTVGNYARRYYKFHAFAGRYENT
jgi:hypothetical protein